MNKRYLFIGLAVAVVFATVFLILGLQDSPTKPAQHLSARLSTLTRLLKEGEANTTNGDLRTLTSEATILITGDQTAINSALSAAGIKAPPKDIVAAESDGSSFKTLADAKLNGQFDATYQRVLETKLDSTAALIKEVYAATSNTKLRSALQNTLENIEMLQTRLAEL